MNVLYGITGLFALGALIGLYLLSFVLQNKKTNKGVAMLHGVFVATALLLLIMYSINHGPNFTESIILFVMAALGGIILIYKDLTGKPLPKWLALGHGLVALTGFVFLVTKIDW